MKKLWMVCLLCFAGLHLVAQDLVYSNLKDLLANDGNLVEGLKVEKRTKNNIVLYGGADYRITANNKSMCKYLKNRCFAVQVDTLLYVNCKKLRYKRLRFGAWYAPAMWLNGNIFFYAIPLGSVAASSSVTMDVTLGGTLGDAIAASGLVSKRVCYEIDSSTGKINFVGKERMSVLLAPYPEWQKSYLEENTESARITKKYLLLLKSVEK
ncbi:hypothetical protein H8744_07725 [Oscillospiraceae bacterium N12]|jgi:hypothetical protein|uniref:Uncharacterized protein n=1 Tax=Jilunia laotingensis TaxID=2763675 RepID=A0A926IPC7_9BACT|nr:DUF6563 family protein [Jilunia laotingensis]MBC8593144.1 hypothetical protein [Jilunia laotingensis]